MGQKVNPNGLRLGIIKSWDSIWFSNKKKFVENIINDDLIRNFLNKNLYKSMISKIFIERLSKNIRIIIYTARPGTIIGKKGEDIDKLKKSVIKISKIPTQINIIEIRKPDLDAKLVSENVAFQIEKRIPFRKAIKKSIQSSIKSGALGIKIKVSGRLGGSEIARTEWYKEGRVPLHTFRANIDYYFSLSKTTYGIIGVKVWIFKGEIFEKINNNKNNNFKTILIEKTTLK